MRKLVGTKWKSRFAGLSRFLEIQLALYCERFILERNRTSKLVHSFQIISAASPGIQPRIPLGSEMRYQPSDSPSSACWGCPYGSVDYHPQPTLIADDNIHEEHLTRGGKNSRLSGFL